MDGRDECLRACVRERGERERDLGSAGVGLERSSFVEVVEFGVRREYVAERTRRSALLVVLVGHHFDGFRNLRFVFCDNLVLWCRRRIGGLGGGIERVERRF